MKNFLAFLLYSMTLFLQPLIAQKIPLPEHPRPDFEREAWANLNGIWKFGFDSLDIGVKEKASKAFQKLRKSY
jgi:hypothetical protein